MKGAIPSSGNLMLRKAFLMRDGKPLVQEGRNEEKDGEL